jgi:hypothetical protein
MVSAWLLALALTADANAPAGDAPEPATETWRTEDAIEEGDEEAAFVEARPGGAGPPEPGRAGRSRARFRVDGGGGRALFATLERGDARGELLLAREAGESRPVDDVHGAVAFAPAPGTFARAGWFEPRAGAGLVLGPRRLLASIAGAPDAVPRVDRPALLAAPLSSVPARAASGLFGVAVERSAGALRWGAVAAWTPREARPSGAALRPVLGTRHRDPAEEERRGRLAERTFALTAQVAPASAPWRAWAVGLLVRTDPRRAPFEGSSAAAESAAAIGTGGAGGELGAAWVAAGRAASLEAAVAWDAGGRTRVRVAATARAAGEGTRAATRAGLVVEGEARGFVPPRALPEKRPHAQAGFVLERRGARPWSVEAQAVERGAGTPTRLSLALALDAGGGIRLAARHEGAPRRSVVSARLAAAASPGRRTEAGVETRFDAAGLSRRTAWVAAATVLPAGFRLALEARLGGGRSGAAWLDDDVSGGRLVRPGRAAARTRLSLGRPGRLSPQVSWARTTVAEGDSDELRLAVHWFAGPESGTGATPRPEAP